MKIKLVLTSLENLTGQCLCIYSFWWVCSLIVSSCIHEMFLEHQISILEWFLKDHVTLQ